jgi:acetyl-CoA acetyltransferase
MDRANIWHDCFTPSEYLAIDHIGLTGPGESWKAIENNEIELGGRWPINPSGGLIGGGHPVGASGVRMPVDAARQVSGTGPATTRSRAQRRSEHSTSVAARPPQSASS